MKKLLSIVLAVATVASVSTSLYAAPRGNLKIAGSTTVLPIVQRWAEEFMTKNPGASISVSGGGTGAGISMLLNGTCNIAGASRAAKAKEVDTARERNSKLVATKIARDGLAIIVNPSNNVKNLTLAQLKDIYSGKVSTWRQAGGHSDANIVVVGRDSASGTYGFFQDTVLGGGAYRRDMISSPSNATVAQAVAQSADAIGYVGMGYADQFAQRGKVHILSISRKRGQPGQKPTLETVKSGSYPLFRYLYVYTLGKPSSLAADFLKFGLSAQGQDLVSKSEFVAL